MSQPVLVTGGAGSVGKCVVLKLREQGRTVRVFDLPNMDYTGLEGKDGIEILRGDLTKPDAVEKAVQGVSGLIHLAALLPPNSEKDRALTFAVNVDGTTRLAEALGRANPGAPLVFSSSVTTYGDTTGAAPPITVNQPQTPLDTYAESKIASERSLLQAYPIAVLLRISGIAVPSIQFPPEVWPFMAKQRIEFVHRDDVVTSLCAALDAQDARGKAFNIAGGPTWRTAGFEYVKDYYELLGAPIEEASFRADPGWCDWYDTDDSQRTLKYQNTPYSEHLARLRAEMEAMMGE